jgi:hypothetical protein
MLGYKVPAIAEAWGKSLGLSGANLTIFDGADGLAKFVGMASALAPQFAKAFAGLTGNTGNSGTDHGQPNGDRKQISEAETELLAVARQNR